MFNLFEKMQELVNDGYDVSINADHRHPSFPFTIRIDKNDEYVCKCYIKTGGIKMFNLFEKMQELVNDGYDVSINADHRHPSFPFTIRIDKNDEYVCRSFDLIDSSDIPIGIDQMIKDINNILKENEHE